MKEKNSKQKNNYETEDYYIKKNVSKYEYDMYKHVYDLNIVNIPEIIDYNEKEKTLTTKKIKKCNISDMYGDSSRDIDSNLFNKIQKIIKKLYDNDIEYPDITGYNFIELGEKIWIIDFENSRVMKNKELKDDFVKEFIDGKNEWNPEYR